ncbi:MAG: hypothetical protein WB729_04030 [Candidatus Sulfotelmatobacter sp.]
MSVNFILAISQQWQAFRDRPFARLVRLFTARIFRGSGDNDAEGLDLSIGLVLTLLALPGGFVSVILFPKYGTLLQWMRGVVNADVIATALPDEYFFIVLSMVVTGAIAVWRWDSIFPDRRDYLNLAPLPISSRTILLANFVGVMFLAVLVAVDVNAASSILFPLAVGSTQNTFTFFARFAAVHALSVVLASVFSFFAVFSVLGIFMAILPRPAFMRISPYLRTLIVVSLVTLLSTSFAVPLMLKQFAGLSRVGIGWLPPVWFLGMGMSWLGQADLQLATLGSIALPALGSAIVLAVCVYSVGYRKHFVRIPELTNAVVYSDGPRWLWLRRLNELVMRAAPQRGCSLFVWKTLSRSEPHRLLLAGVGGLGLVLASQALFGAFAGGTIKSGHLSAEILSVPLILAFFVIAGLRLAFEIPVDLRANWIFRLMLNSKKHDCQAMARKLILLSIAPGLLIALPAYCWLGGWRAGILHTLVVGVWSIFLTDTVLIRFHKMPFTCSLPLFQQHSIVTLLLCAMGFFFFAVLTPEFEAWALPEPVRLMGLIPVALVAWYIPHRIRQNALEIERALIFEELPARGFELLGIAE